MSNTYIKKGTYTKESKKESTCSQLSKKELLKLADFLNTLNWPDSDFITYNKTYDPNTVYKAGDIVMIDDSWKGIIGCKVEESETQPDDFLFLPDLNNDGISDQADVQELLASFTNGNYKTLGLKFNYWYKVADNYVKIVNDITNIGSQELKTVAGQELKGVGNIDVLSAKIFQDVDSYTSNKPIIYNSDFGTCFIGSINNLFSGVMCTNRPEIIKTTNQLQLTDSDENSQTTSLTAFGRFADDNEGNIGLMSAYANSKCSCSVYSTNRVFGIENFENGSIVDTFIFGNNQLVTTATEIALRPATGLTTVKADTLIIDANTISLRSAFIDDAYDEGVEPSQFVYAADGEMTMIPVYRQETSEIFLPVTGVYADAVTGNIYSESYFAMYDMSGNILLGFKDGEVFSDYVDNFGASFPEEGDPLDVLTLTSSGKPIWSKYYAATDLSYKDTYGNVTSTQNTANCYVIRQKGFYKFPLVYGNAIKNGKTNTAAYTNLALNDNMMDFVNAYGKQIISPYIEEDLDEVITVGQFSIGDADIFKNISVTDGYLYFQVTDIPKTGANGVLSVKDSSGTIVWNWHIWVFPYDLTPVTITNKTGVNYDIMPVFLATTYDYGDITKRKNWYYQWGRSVPLLGPRSYNTGYASATSYGQLELYINSSLSDPSPYQKGITSPTTLLKMKNYDCWFFTGHKLYLNLWDASCSTPGCSDNTTVKTVYDPSPVGFKVPNGNTFAFAPNSTIGSFSKGWKIKKNSSDKVGIFFPASGYRLGYTPTSVSNCGRVWTAADMSSGEPDVTGKPCGLFFDSIEVGKLQGYKAQYGFSICCVVD